MKKLVFTKSIAFEKQLIDKLEDYLKMGDGASRINFSAEVSDLIESGLKYKQMEKESPAVLKKPTLNDIVRKK